MSSGKGSQADSGQWPAAQVDSHLLGVPFVLWQPAQGAQWIHRSTRADSGQRCSRVTSCTAGPPGHRASSDPPPVTPGPGEGGGPAGAEGRGQLDPGPDARTARVRGWGSGQSVWVRWTLPSPAQPWESADKKRGGHPLSSTGAGSGAACSRGAPRCPGSSGGSWTLPSEAPGVAGQPSLARSTLCPLRDCHDVWGRSPGATLIPPLRRPDAWSVSALRRSPQASRLGEVKSHWHTPT